MTPTAETTQPETLEGQAPPRAAEPMPLLTNAFTQEHKINLAKFDETQRARITQIVTGCVRLDSATVMAFGADVQRRTNGYLDSLLQGIRTCDVGVAGELTLELSHSIKDMKLEQMKKEADGEDWVARTFGKLPLVGHWVSAIRYFQLAHQEILKRLAEIEAKAQREIGKVNAYNQKLDQLVDVTLGQLADLELYMAAGQAILMRSRSEFERQRDELATTGDVIGLTQLRDFAEQINAFETRLLRMHVAFTDAQVSVPQIRMTQESGRIEACNIMDTLLFDLPRLKGAILRVAALTQISQASRQNEARRELTRTIGTIGGEALDEAYTRAKESQGSSAADIAALAATADKLLETMAKGQRIDEENRRKRADAENQLDQVQTKLLDGLHAIANSVVA
jgi:uncharacterized protein YaaN involved in tellurite resistance